MAPLKVLM
ncbi:hypothetical protein CISIN_1g0487041mg, partial [Citrus sinensis]